MLGMVGGEAETPVELGKGIQAAPHAQEGLLGVGICPAVNLGRGGGHPGSLGWDQSGDGLCLEPCCAAVGSQWGWAHLGAHLGALFIALPCSGSSGCTARLSQTPPEGSRKEKPLGLFKCALLAW